MISSRVISQKKIILQLTDFLIIEVGVKVLDLFCNFPEDLTLFYEKKMRYMYMVIVILWKLLCRMTLKIRQL